MYDGVNGDPTYLYVKYTDTSAVTDTTKAPRVESQDVLSRVDAVAINMTVIDDKRRSQILFRQQVVLRRHTLRQVTSMFRDTLSTWKVVVHSSTNTAHFLQPISVS